MEIQKRVPEVTPTAIKAMGINCSHKTNVSHKSNLYSYHLVGEDDRLHPDILSPHNPYISPHGLVFKPIIAAAKGMELADMISINKRFKNHTKADTMLHDHLLQIARG